MAFAREQDRYDPRLIPRDPDHGLATWVWIDNPYIRPHWSLEFFDEEFFCDYPSKCIKLTVGDLIDRIRTAREDLIMDAPIDVDIN